MSHPTEYILCFFPVYFFGRSASTFPTLSTRHKMKLDGWPEPQFDFPQRNEKIIVKKLIAEADDFWQAPAKT